MKNWENIAEEYRRNYEYAARERQRLSRKKGKMTYDYKRMCLLDEICTEQKLLYKQCIEILKRSGNK